VLICSAARVYATGRPSTRRQRSRRFRPTWFAPAVGYLVVLLFFGVPGPTSTGQERAMVTGTDPVGYPTGGGSRGVSLRRCWPGCCFRPSWPWPSDGDNGHQGSQMGSGTPTPGDLPVLRPGRRRQRGLRTAAAAWPWTRASWRGVHHALGCQHLPARGFAALVLPIATGALYYASPENDWATRYCLSCRTGLRCTTSRRCVTTTRARVSRHLGTLGRVGGAHCLLGGVRPGAVPGHDRRFGDSAQTVGGARTPGCTR